ncbi:hypothetical protein BTN49_0874 [Candidatus Enterovibrio escicola]|uniref:Uncharacterized protein n=1 Tax=Candidatus Enterovibrio escicola TaxID=1927127 RepID=A0A2A5T6Z0_9GAMM|nr:hypothetical protein BTN49_0874 [Candidatus Enterovibrio escacola]
MSSIPPLSRLASIAKNLRKRFNEKSWHVNTKAKASIKIANVMLCRMGTHT